MKDAVKKDMSVRQIHFYSEAYKTDAEMQNDRDITLALAEKRPELYRYASDRVKADKEVAKTCFGSDGSLIRFAPDSVRADPEVALVAVSALVALSAFVAAPTLVVPFLILAISVTLVLD